MGKYIYLLKQVMEKSRHSCCNLYIWPVLRSSRKNKTKTKHWDTIQVRDRSPLIHISYPSHAIVSRSSGFVRLHNSRFSQQKPKLLNSSSGSTRGHSRHRSNSEKPQGTPAPSSLVRRTPVYAGRNWLVIAGRAAAVERGCLSPCPETAHLPTTGHMVWSSSAENPPCQVRYFACISAGCIYSKANIGLRLFPSLVHID